MPTGGDQRWRSPAHAGRLPPWERLTIVLVLVLIAVGIGAAVLSSNAQVRGKPHSPPNPGIDSRRPAPSGSPAGGTTATTGQPATLKPEPDPRAQPAAPSPTPVAGGF